MISLVCKYAQTIDNRILILYYFKLLLKIESAFKIYIYNLQILRACMFVLHSVHLDFYDTIALSVERYYMRKRPSKQTSLLPLLSVTVYSLRERKLAVTVLVLPLVNTFS